MTARSNRSRANPWASQRPTPRISGSVRHCGAGTIGGCRAPQTPRHRCAGATSSIVPRPAPRCRAKARGKPSPHSSRTAQGRARRAQVSALGGRPWQYFAVVRSSESSSGNILARCVPGRQSVAIFSLHAFPKGPRTGKAPLLGKISSPCIQNELALARYAHHASEKRCKAPSGNA